MNLRSALVAVLLCPLVTHGAVLQDRMLLLGSNSTAGTTITGRFMGFDYSLGTLNNYTVTYGVSNNSFISATCVPSTCWPPPRTSTTQTIQFGGSGLVPVNELVTVNTGAGAGSTSNSFYRSQYSGTFGLESISPVVPLDMWVTFGPIVVDNPQNFGIISNFQSGFSFFLEYDYTPGVSPVPLPAPALLLGTGFMLLARLSSRRLK